LRILVRLLAALGGLLVLAVAGVALFAGFRLATYEPLLDERHLEAKQHYLASVEAGGCQGRTHCPMGLFPHRARLVPWELKRLPQKENSTHLGR